MSTFITADSHFGHVNIIKLCNRPFSSVDEMNQVLVERWNDVVGDGDTVYHIGDFFWTEKAAKSVLPQLKGQIKLILGNHDRNWRRVYERVKFSNLEVLKDQILELKTPIRAVLCHYPLLSWNGAYYKVPHFHGHVHVSLPSEGLRHNVSVEQTNYYPVNIEEIIK